MATTASAGTIYQAASPGRSPNRSSTVRRRDISLAARVRSGTPSGGRTHSARNRRTNGVARSGGFFLEVPGQARPPGNRPVPGTGVGAAQEAPLPARAVLALGAHEGGPQNDSPIRPWRLEATASP
jgi:hypothetical protein